MEKGGANVTFIIGAYDGLPEEIRSKYPLISLSQMTWTHSMARLLLIEQVYRASEIRKGSGYHKE
jgi:23S rRNA (pseudouridine1915-N3)-methyltransferase